MNQEWITDAGAVPALGGADGTTGGSCVGAILGCSKFSDQHQKWMVMTGRHVVETNAAMRRGNILEPVVAAMSMLPDLMPSDWLAWPTESGDPEFVQAAHLRVPVVRSFRWPNDDRMSASIDREVHVDTADGQRLIGINEIKTQHIRNKWQGGSFTVDGVEITTDVPPSHWCQVQHYLEGRNVEHCWITALQLDSPGFDVLIHIATRNAVPSRMAQAPGQYRCELNVDSEDGPIWLDPVAVERAAEMAALFVAKGVGVLQVARIDRDPVYAATILPYLRSWHDRHITGDEPPPADGSDGCTDRLYMTRRRAGDVPMTDELEQRAREVDEIKRSQKALTARRKLLDNEIRDLLGEGLAAKNDRAKILIVTSDPYKQCDRKRVKAEHPEIWDACSYLTKGSHSVRVEILDDD